jgi:hypothetical protein
MKAVAIAKLEKEQLEFQNTKKQLMLKFASGLKKANIF